ncbi:hypothetical protein P8C59_009512 [Phyllachora maydis]|uniref:Uncharacterized protein n=1 Tax=Phyllachora maydis TaxID=1825666 RepID=A0AAD9ICT0_9PEZI|nr:hypothetical protein P8C59_009512 [Phyllachora maydis]
MEKTRLKKQYFEYTGLCINLTSNHICCKLLRPSLVKKKDMYKKASSTLLSRTGCWNAEDYAYDPLSDYLPHLYQNEEFGLSFLGGDNVDAHPVSVSDTCIPDAVPNEPPLLLGGARIQYQGSPGHLGMNFSSADASDHSQSVAMVSPVSPRPPGPQADWIDANPLLAPTPDLEVRGLPCTLPPTAKLVQPPLVPAAGSAVIGPVDTSAPSLECLDGCMLCRACSCECAT